MKRLFLATCIVLLSLTAVGQRYFDTSDSNDKPVLVLMNPTVNNLKTIFYLIDNGIFPVQDGTRLVGFFHTSQTYDFGLSADFISDSRREDVYLHACSQIPGKHLYGENPCSDDFRKVFGNSRGVIFFGGPDIPPAFYGEETDLLTVITDYHRHAIEASFLFHLLGGSQNTTYSPLLDQNPEYMIMGICLGMQTMNIATGGTMIQDIPSEIYGKSTVEQILSMDSENLHRNYYTNLGTDKGLLWGSFHRIKAVETGNTLPFFENSSPHPGILSSHHQAVEKIGKGFVVAATSIDGKIPEIIVHERYPHVIGFQFHPEPPLLYKADEKIKITPGGLTEKSFIDLYPGSEGETFNRNIWKWAAGALED